MQDWAIASLRIYSQFLTAEEIGRLLQSVPTHSFEKGTPISTRNPTGPARDQSIWVLSSRLDGSKHLDEHIEELVTFIEQKLPQLEKLCSSCEIDLFCGFSFAGGQGGFELGSALLKRLTALPVDIVFDLYSTSPVSDVEENPTKGREDLRDLRKVKKLKK